MNKKKEGILFGPPNDHETIKKNILGGIELTDNLWTVDVIIAGARGSVHPKYTNTPERLTLPPSNYNIRTDRQIRGFVGKGQLTGTPTIVFGKGCAIAAAVCKVPVYDWHMGFEEANKMYVWNSEGVVENDLWIVPQGTHSIDQNMVDVIAAGRTSKTKRRCFSNGKQAYFQLHDKVNQPITKTNCNPYIYQIPGRDILCFEFVPSCESQWEVFFDVSNKWLKGYGLCAD